MRTVNRVASLLLGALLFLIGAAIALQAVLFLVHRPVAVFPVREWNDLFARTQVGSTGVLIASVVAVLVGLAVVALQLIPVPPARLAAGGPGDGQADTDGNVGMVAGRGDGWWLPRRPVQRRVAAAAAGVPGVIHAKAVVKGRPQRWRLTVDADVAGRDPAAANQAAEKVTGAVRQELATLGADPSVPVAVHTHRKAVLR